MPKPDEVGRRHVDAAGGMGPGAPGFARVPTGATTGKLSLAHATRELKYDGALACRRSCGRYNDRIT